MNTTSNPQTTHVLRNTSLALSLAVLAACASTPKDTQQVAAARSAISAAEQDPAASKYSAVDIEKAREAMALSDKAAKDGKLPVTNHYAYLAQQTALTAVERAKVKTAEERIAQGESERNRIQLSARENEVRQARSAAESADARAMQTEAKNERLTEESARMAAERARLEADSAAKQAEAARMAEQLAQLQAKQTPRGLVLTLGDVLFDTGKAEIKPGAERNLDRLVQFLTTHTERKVLVEGFTDSVGSDATNLALSERRAAAVRAALAGRGVDAGRVDMRGYGEAEPVASNDDSGGRQQNRRVEVVISNDAGEIPAR